MSIRAILFGLLGAVLVCGTTYINDRVIRQTYLVGCALPTAVYGMLLLFVFLNPLLKRMRKGLEFRAAELAVMMTITLAACCIPSAGLLETMPDALMMPHRYAKTNPGWKSEDVVGMAPKKMLADPDVDDGRGLVGYDQGLSTPKKRIGFSDVPWGAWTRTLAFWLPIVFCLWVGLAGLSVMLHRRWSEHEKLPYPIASFAASLLPKEDSTDTPFYRNSVFWIGCGLAIFVHTTGYLAKCFPGEMVAIPREFDFTALRELFPKLVDGGGWRLLKPKLFFAVVGLGYLLPKKTSFSLGIGPAIFCSVAGMLTGYGLTVGAGGMYEANIKRALQAGVYVGVMCIVLYNGRHYYMNVAKATVGLKPKDPVEAMAAWGARVFLVCAVLVVLQLALAGLDWQLAVLVVALLTVIFVVIGRISAETGHIFIQPEWNPAVFIVGFLGVRALGPTTALLLFLVCSVLVVDTRESILPFLMNSYRVLDQAKAKSKHILVPVCISLAVGLLVAVPITLYVKYDRGTDHQYTWSTQYVAKFAFDETLKHKRQLAAQGVLAESEAVSGFKRLFAMRVDSKWLIGFAIGLGLFVLLSTAHLRLPWWPIHPCIMFFWATYGGVKFAPSFFFAFIIKALVIKYGGEQASQRLKPFMIGLIAADMLFGISSSILGVIYYLVTGQPPVRFGVLIG